MSHRGADGIVIDKVTKHFVRKEDGRHMRAFRVLDEVSIQIGKDEFVAVIGPSGCGKTTLLRIVAGLVMADKGSVLVDGMRVNGPGRERAVVFQQPSLLPWAHVLDNIAFGLKLQGMDRRSRIECAQTLVDLVGLRGFELALPRQLSGGMQQRVGLARALAVDPRYLLMDEPFGSLDEITRRTMQSELMRIWTSETKGAMFITHSVDEATILSDRVIVMGTRPGRVIADVRIDVPRPRSHKQESSREFLLARDRIWSVISGGNGASSLVDEQALEGSPA